MTCERQVAATLGFVVFSLFNLSIGLTVRDENRSVFNRDIISDRRQLMLFGLSFLFIFVPVELGLPRFLGLANINGYAWLYCFIAAFLLLLVDEVIKFFRRRSAKAAKSQEETVAVTGPQPAA